MSRVRNKDSKAEMAIRRRLHALGFRYRVHYRVVGRPDVVFPRERVAVFVDGDMWHGNAWKLRGLNSLAEMFPHRTEWWVAKIERTIERDRDVSAQLTALGWEVLRIWESEIIADAEAQANRVARVVARRRQSLLQKSAYRPPTKDVVIE